MIKSMKPFQKISFLTIIKQEVYLLRILLLLHSGKEVYLHTGKAKMNLLNQANPPLALVINPEYDELKELKDCNVIYTKNEGEKECSLPLVLYFFKTKKTIYQTNSYNGNILRIHYKDNVIIYLNLITMIHFIIVTTEYYLQESVIDSIG